MSRLNARRLVSLPSLNSVGVSQTATSSLPVGARKYHALIYKYKAGADNQATVEAAITTVRLLLGGKEQWKISLARLNILNALDGFAFQTGHIIIPLSRFAARTPQGEEAFGWGTANVSSFTVEFDISAAAVAPAITGWGEIEDTVENIGVIIKRRTFTGYAAAAAGSFQIKDLPRRDAYNRIHIFTVQASAVKVVADSVEFFDAPRTVSAMSYSRRALSHPANTYSVIFDATQQVTDLVPMIRNVPGLGNVEVQEFRLDVTMDAAATFDVLTETVGQPD